MARYADTDEEWEALESESNELLGQLTMVWDDIDWFLFLIFERLLGVPQHVAWPVFYSHQNHRARRDMVEALGDMVLRTSVKDFKAFHPLIRRIRKFAERRNAVTHAVWNRIEDKQNGKQLIRITRTKYQGQDFHLATGVSVPDKLIEKYRYDFKKLRRTISDVERLRDDIQEFWHGLAWLDKLPARYRGMTGPA